MTRQRPLLATFLFIGLAAALVTAGCTLQIPLGEPVILPGSVPGLDAGREIGLASFEPGKLIVRMDDGFDPELAAERLDAEIVQRFPGLNGALLALQSDESLPEALERARSLPGVRYVDPNYTYTAAAWGAPAFSDGRQWAPQKIGAPRAWEITTGSPHVVIAVLDSGVDSSHPELTDKVLPGINTVDEGSFDVNDGHGHGTHVAAVAAASASAGHPRHDMLGIAFDSVILPVKVLNDDGGGSVASVAEGILAAVAWYQERKQTQPELRMVMNLSLGGPGYSLFLQEAVDAALQADIVVVAAMGNSGRGQLTFPAAYPGVIAVAATDPRDRPAVFSARGPHVSVAAPGVDIHSAAPGGGYARWSGTSMAAPHVAGAAGLILAGDPTLSAAEVKALLESTAYRPDGALFDDRIGYGRIDVGRAVTGEPSQRYGTVMVTVVEGGSPVPYADVMLLGPSGLPLASRKANGQGAAAFFAVPVGDGYRVGTSRGGGAMSQPFTVRPDEAAAVELTLGGRDALSTQPSREDEPAWKT